MLGFEITHKDEVVLATLEKGCISVIIDRIVREEGCYVNVHFGGLAIEKGASEGTSFLWYDKDLHSGDEILVKVKEVTKNSPVIADDKIEKEQQFSAENLNVVLVIEGKRYKSPFQDKNHHILLINSDRDYENEITLDFIGGKINGETQWIYKNELKNGDEFRVLVE